MTSIINLQHILEVWVCLWSPSSWSNRRLINHHRHEEEEEDIYTKTLARPSAPAVAKSGRDGWKVTSKMDSSNFFRCDVISCTQVRVSRFQSLILQSWPSWKEKQINQSISSIIKAINQAKLTAREKIKTIRIGCQAWNFIQMSNHWMGTSSW